MSEPFTLKPGDAYRRIHGQWVLETADEEALRTAIPAGECDINGTHCVDFQDALGREWAQTENKARDA